MSFNKERLEQKFSEEYGKLNAQQRKAVDTIEGPVMVIAGPGTGKTQILASRIGKILSDTDASPENILCLTYTDAGVVAMRNPVAFTADFRLPKAVTVAAGKTHEVPVKVLADGSRGFSRLLFWTGPGEYKLAAKYRLARNQDGEQGEELKSEPVKIVVSEK